LAFKEEMLIVSRGGICYITDKGAELYKIDNNYVNATFVGIRVNETEINRLGDFYTKERTIMKLGKSILHM